jgi:MFS transporter, DHA2 family, multidrug resistance protein
MSVALLLLQGTISLSSREIAMNASPATSHAVPRHHGDNKLVVGIVLEVVTFWLFAQTTLNVAPAIRDDLRIAESINTSPSALPRCSRVFSSSSPGGLADRLGRVKLTNVGMY